MNASCSPSYCYLCSVLSGVCALAGKDGLFCIRVSLCCLFMAVNKYLMPSGNILHCFSFLQLEFINTRTTYSIDFVVNVHFFTFTWLHRI